MSKSDRRSEKQTRRFPAARVTDCRTGAFKRTVPTQAGLRANPWGRRGLLGDLELRIHPFLSAFAASLIAMLPVHVWAQTPQDATATPREESVSVRDRDRPEYDAQGARFGSFVLNSSLDLEVTSTDNLFAAPSSSDFEDIIYTATPMARLSSDWSRNAFAIDVGATLTTHRDFSNEDADSYFARVSGRLDVGDSTEISAAARAAHQVTPRTDPDSPFIGSPVEYDRADVSAGVKHRFARFTVSLDGGNSTYDYDNLPARDNDQTFVRGRIEGELSPRIGLFVEAQADERSYDNSPNFDSEGRAYMAGVTVNTDLMNGELAVGQFDRDYSGGVGAVDGLAVAGQLEWYITQLTTLTFNARRDADDQIGLTSGLPYVAEEYGARVDHELLRNVILTASIQRGQREYESVDRQDDYTKVEAGVDYLLNRRAAVNLRYQRGELDSQGAVPYRDYEVNEVSVGLTLRL